MLLLAGGLSVTGLQGDYLHLKDDRIADGKFVTVDGANYVFKSGGRLLRAPIRETAKMVVGYRGAPVCFRLHGGLKDCSGLLFVLDSREALIGHFIKRDKGLGKGRDKRRGGWMKASRVRLDRIAFLEFKTAGGGRLPLVRPGVKLRPLDKPAPGVVMKAGRNRIRFRMRDGSETSFQAGLRAVSIRLLPPQTVGPEKPASDRNVVGTGHYFVPGLVQRRRGQKVTGGIFLGMFAGLGALAYQEFRHASRMARKINGSPVELYFSSLAGGNRSAYAAHVNRYQGLLSLQLLVYGLHWMHAVGWWPFNVNSPASGLGLQLIPGHSRSTAGSPSRLFWQWRF